MSFYSKNGASTSVQSHRKTWNKTEYEIKANERLTKEREAVELSKKGKKPRLTLPDGSKPPPPKKLLEARMSKVDLDTKIGKQVVINKTTISSDTGGYYCDVCDCIMKDSVNYLDHINGKNHQRNLGFSMKVKKSTLGDIKDRLASMKQQQEKTKRRNDVDSSADIKEEEAKLADLKKQKRDQKSRKRPAPVDDEAAPVDDELFKMMGLSGFGGSKKNN